jgi:parallel beta-helix repeat protein
MRRVTRAALGAVLLAALGCRTTAVPPGAEMVVRDRVFTGETTLAGRVLLAGECRVPAGATLRILPGTRILFIREDLDGDGIGDARLRVEGRILAEGTHDSPVVFSSAGDAAGRRRPGDWDAILLNFSRGNLFRHVIVEYSNYSLHAHFSEGVVDQCLIRRNNEGCRLGNSTFLIEGCLVRENVFKGLNFRACANTVRGNEITANGNGIFIFERDGGTTITGNNIFGNERYDLRLDDFFTGTLLLDDDWWGSNDETVVREKVYDSRQDPDIGSVTLRLAPAPHSVPPPVAVP